MIALQLVVGTPVKGAKVESLKGWPIVNHSKRDTDKSACGLGGTGNPVASHVNLNEPVLKLPARDDYESCIIRGALRRGIGDANPLAAFVRFCFSFQARWPLLPTNSTPLSVNA